MVRTVPLQYARPLLHHRRHRCGLCVARLEDRTLLSGPSGDVLAAVAPKIELGTSKTGTLAPGEVAFFQIDPTTDGRLVAGVQPETMRLSLLDDRGHVLMQSDGQSPGNPDDQIDLHVPAGTDYLEVENLGGAGRYALTTTLTQASDPIQPIPVGDDPDSIVSGDFTGDGRTDLAVANEYNTVDDLGNVSVLLGNGDGTFTAAGQFATTPHATPLVADVNGEGTEDVLVINGAGDILYRQGVPGQPGTFEPPVTVNPGNPSRDIAWVPNTDQGPVLASVDAHDNKISLYAYRDGGFVLVSQWNTGFLPSQIITADLNGDGLTDLVVRNAGDGTLSVFFGTEFVGPINPKFVTPQFSPPVTIPVGLGVSDVEVVDTTGSGRLDLVVTNKLTGQVSILQNLDSNRKTPQRCWSPRPTVVPLSSSSGGGLFTAGFTDNEYAGSIEKKAESSSTLPAA